MTESRYCLNHPRVIAVGDCIGCGSSLCGMCSRFGDEGIRCERCEAAFENELQVRRQTEKLRQPALPAVSETAPEKSDREGSVRVSQVFAWLKWVSVILVLLGAAVPLYFYAYPHIEAPAVSPTRAREEAATALIKCLQVFRRIGEQLQAGQEPDMSLRCAAPAGANLLQREGTTIRVTHPNPRLYGYRSITVTNQDPEPVALK